jgi:glucose-6-phosphate 1-dehydrogenase
MHSQSSTIELKDDTIIVVLGASGDLAKKKTVCALVPRLPVCTQD